MRVQRPSSVRTNRFGVCDYDHWQSLLGHIIINIIIIIIMVAVGADVRGLAASNTCPREFSRE